MCPAYQIFHEISSITSFIFFWHPKETYCHSIEQNTDEIDANNIKNGKLNSFLFKRKNKREKAGAMHFFKNLCYYFDDYYQKG